MTVNPAHSPFRRKPESITAQPAPCLIRGLRGKSPLCALRTQRRWIPAFAGMAVMFFMLVHAFAADTPAQVVESSQLQKCLQRADELPDIAAAEATVWIKKNGGDDAHLCRAFAQSNRGMHEDAGREFWGLASVYDKSDPNRAVVMHNFSGQEFLQAKDVKNAEAQYTAALKIAPDNVPSLVGQAQARMAVEKYWDAVDDLNHALKVKPDSVEALRQRGRAWTQLGNDKNAQEDFEHAAMLAGDKTEP